MSDVVFIVSDIHTYTFFLLLKKSFYFVVVCVTFMSVYNLCNNNKKEKFDDGSTFYVLFTKCSTFSFLLISFRKTCLVCKCPRDTHAIYQEQVTSVKERLGFKPTTNVSTLDAKQLGYTWIPPGITTTNKVSSAYEAPSKLELV